MQTEIIKICPVCGSESFAAFLTCKDYTYSQLYFNLQKCTNCGFVLTNPRPPQEAIGKYYESEQYISHTGKSNNLFDHIYLKARAFTLRWKHKLITSKQPAGTLLDFGCGTGAFLIHMSEHNWDVTGIEPSPAARSKALLHFKQKSIYENLNDLGPKKFDIITLWHVLEHVPNPGELLAKLKTILNVNGLIFVAVPNHESFDAKHYREFWAGYDVPRHLWHFSQSTMKRLLINQNLSCLQIVPMKLDAYYVSLLSEKYKNKGKHNLLTPLKAVVNGLRSNSKADQSRNYSSLIYIAGHA